MIVLFVVYFNYIHSENSEMILSMYNWFLDDEWFLTNDRIFFSVSLMKKINKDDAIQV
jgi:hypothetical protein